MHWQIDMNNLPEMGPNFGMELNRWFIGHLLHTNDHQLRFIEFR